MTPLAWTFDDGGRRAAGFKGTAGDCVTRALAIVAGVPYLDCYRLVAERVQGTPCLRLGGQIRGLTAGAGVPTEITADLFADLDWTWTSAASWEHTPPGGLRFRHIPDGLVVASLRGHVAAVINRTIHDTYDPSDGGNRPLRGFWRPE